MANNDKLNAEFKDKLHYFIIESLTKKMQLKVKKKLFNAPLDENLKNLLNPKNKTKINQLFNDMENNSNITINVISETIKNDELLASAIIRIMNNPINRRTKHIDNVATAVKLLGPKKIRRIINYSGFSSILKSSELVSLRRIIFNSIFSAHVFADVMNEHFKKQNEKFKMQSDENFNLGLLHNVGKLIQLYYYSKEKENEIEDNDNPEHIREFENELEFFGITHDLFGCLLGIEFNFNIESLVIICMHHFIRNGFTIAGKNKENDLYLKIWDSILKHFAETCINEDSKNELLTKIIFYSTALTLIDDLSYNLFKNIYSIDKSFFNFIFFDSKDDSNEGKYSITNQEFFDNVYKSISSLNDMNILLDEYKKNLDLFNEKFNFELKDNFIVEEKPGKIFNINLLKEIINSIFIMIRE